MPTQTDNLIEFETRFKNMIAESEEKIKEANFVIKSLGDDMQSIFKENIKNSILALQAQINRIEKDDIVPKVIMNSKDYNFINEGTEESKQAALKMLYDMKKEYEDISQDQINPNDLTILNIYNDDETHEKIGVTSEDSLTIANEIDKMNNFIIKLREDKDKLSDYIDNRHAEELTAEIAKSTINETPVEKELLQAIYAGKKITIADAAKTKTKQIATPEKEDR